MSDLKEYALKMDDGTIRTFQLDAKSAEENKHRIVQTKQVTTPKNKADGPARNK